MEQAMMVLERELDNFIGSIYVKDPVSFRNMTVFPLFSDVHSENGYTLLDDAISTDKFVVQEVSEGGSVPELMVNNCLTDADVLILQGEQLVGAKQNRVVNVSIIVPRAASIKIPVSCCEQNRWSYKSRNFSSSNSPLYASLRKRSSEAVHESLKSKRGFQSDQSGIWNSVREKSERMSSASKTSAMEDIYAANEADLGAYEAAFKAQPGQMGFISAIDGNIVGCDVFGADEILPKVYQKLLRGYILDAIDIDRNPKAEGVAPGKPVAVPLNAKKFLSKVLTAKKEFFKSPGEGDEIRFEDKKMSGFALMRNKSLVHMAAFA